jgi:cobalt-zinc-cadmium resistance protein CzcA
MFQKLITYSIRHKLVIGVLSIALAIWGVWSLVHLPFDSTPDITDNQVQVITQAPSLGAQEVEQYVTTPVEMALANIPRIQERRSISRSGLSVITLVFDDAADIYWARSQVSQVVEQLEKELPKNTETEMGPIATGLGEIYHYTIRAKEGYEHKYSLTQLRTMQDWIVRKQLSGTPGIAEVSGWGGYVKQYEVAINTDQLNASGVSVSEVFDALQRNNANTGGSYIEQNSNQYYIRGIGVVKNLEDIANITVKTVDGTPVKVGDVAKVQLGHATRFGAVTRNGEGEVVAGIAIMLKGENFQEVIKNVKERISLIQKSLPEGVVIEPFIDRTNLVDRVEGTIARNLIEGGLIVIFVLVIFLGNWRAGLVVASVIPLSMLFAFGMMKTFGIDGNLMSLGAIDFGMIVDSAVIIVEAVVTHINTGHFSQPEVRAAYLAQCQNGGAATPFALTQKQMDEEVHFSASRIRQSAAFGEIIIMIVYIPLMTLVGIEGKMFRPMALTVFFAILGAFILSLTYVPMASSLMLSRKVHTRKTFSDRVIEKLQAWYRPVLDWVLARNKDVITGAVALFCVSVVGFKYLGGEFIPSLEEGDFAVEMSMSQGTSLSQMVESCTKAEKLLKKEYPEIKQVVSRIGSAEIPTDPMPVERADIMIALKPKAEWTSAKTTPELMEKMEETLSAIPGLEAEISQPIQMRNNELLTGIKQDVAIKIFGDDLDVLTQQAGKVKKMIEDVPGVSGIFVEEVAGLPQIQVKYNHEKMAAYGVSVDDISEILETTFAGAVAGSLYEGDKKFDIVLRIDPSQRNVETLEQLSIPLKDGTNIPLSQVADIDYSPAPAQVSHEDGARRIYVGFNVKGRDVQSTVEDIQEILDEKLKLPDGYYYNYGGEFENLQSATNRLMVVIPIALVIILLLLYATVKNVRESLFVFSAIPLAAIGGVWALWLRGMPFSISAGVGFIALFGVAVLNGIVLIGQMNQMQREEKTADKLSASMGVTELIHHRIIESCMVRLRPVLMTALVASMGFLPMALSQGDGAEVQRPLATVVIGGLITSTLLTLLVLPAIYKTFTKK